MGVRVTTSQYNHGEKGDVLVEHLYQDADSWNLRVEGSEDHCKAVYLEIVDSENDRVVALFDGFSHVEVVESEEED